MPNIYISAILDGFFTSLEFASMSLILLAAEIRNRPRNIWKTFKWETFKGQGGGPTCEARFLAKYRYIYLLASTYDDSLGRFCEALTCNIRELLQFGFNIIRIADYTKVDYIFCWWLQRAHPVPGPVRRHQNNRTGKAPPLSCHSLAHSSTNRITTAVVLRE